MNLVPGGRHRGAQAVHQPGTHERSASTTVTRDTIDGPARRRGGMAVPGATVLLARCGRVDGLAQDCYRPVEAEHGLCQLRQALARLNQTHSQTPPIIVDGGSPHVVVGTG